MQKNVAGQKLQFFAFVPSTGLPKTGAAANITIYVSKDHGAATALADTSATEMDATDAKGVYVVDVSQTETNADELTFTGKSSTSEVSIVPRFITTTPANYSGLVITSGRANADVTHNGGTAITAAAGVQEVKVASIAANAITAAATATDFGTEIRDAITLRTTLRGTASGTPTTTSIPTSAMSPATSVADQVKGRIVIFDHDTTTAALRGQATDITASSASATPTLTVTALTTAPVSGDTFTIV